jgi:hypothetical protein
MSVNGVWRTAIIEIPTLFISYFIARVHNTLLRRPGWRFQHSHSNAYYVSYHTKRYNCIDFSLVNLKWNERGVRYYTKLCDDHEVRTLVLISCSLHSMTIPWPFHLVPCQSIYHSSARNQIPRTHSNEGPLGFLSPLELETFYLPCCSGAC